MKILRTNKDGVRVLVVLVLVLVTMMLMVMVMLVLVLMLMLPLHCSPAVWCPLDLSPPLQPRPLVRLTPGLFSSEVRPVLQLLELPQSTLLRRGLCYHCDILHCCLWPLGVVLVTAAPSFRLLLLPKRT